ncbi:MAG TPA: hypothetical protein VJ983_05035 [candidate division Zixibacteria bacterium]|nr:hypothetical protein [candidate division Zixibacteria bacterium]
MTLEDYSKQIAELLRLLKNEEEEFLARSRQMQIDDSHLLQAHQITLTRTGQVQSHERMRHAHEAMFKVHRKIKNEHDEAIRRSIAVLRQVEQGKYTSDECGLVLDRLEQQLQTIRREHQLMERERKQILREHEAWVAQLDRGINS